MFNKALILALIGFGFGISYAQTQNAPPATVTLPEDEQPLQQQIANDIDNFIVSQRALNTNVAALNNDQKNMIDLLRSKIRWYQECVANKPCVDWVNHMSTPVKK